METMTALAIKPLEVAWDRLNTLMPVFPIRTQQQYDQATDMLNGLLDIVGDNETHPLYDLLDTLGTLVRVYEDNLYPEPDINEVDVLKYLMLEHNISDMPEIGDKDYINALLSGQHQMTIGDVKALSQRFNVSVTTFLN
jgi:HTH-type transcriptional regulator/antitoxin HigA